MSSSAGAMRRLVPGVPALFTSRSSRPRSATALSTIFSAPAASPTLPGAMIALPPMSISLSTAWGPRGSSSRKLIATVAPNFASIVAVANPMPEAPPVTKAVLPVRS